MTKVRHSNREPKKQSTMTLKEKRIGKKSKKNAKTVVQPLVGR
jgi:hypothetical protein